MPERSRTPHGDAAVYLAAAALIAAGKNVGAGYADEDGQQFNGACDVLSCAMVPYSLGRRDLREQFWETFVEGEGYFLMSDVLREPEAQKVRVLALCFMAAMTENPDD